MAATFAADTAPPTADLTQTVAKHYNELQEGGREERGKSRIFYQRNFNNWIKSMAISDTIDKVRERFGRHQPLTVLDLCSGKGGDLLKWKIGKIDKLICADIAGTSIEQCEGRYKEMVERGRRDRYPQRLFDAEFITADCTKLRLKDLYKDPDVQFDLVSCQFSFHYCFESLPQAEMMLQNACECLKPGGYFIGTTPDAYEMVKRLQAADGMSFGNEVYRITFDGDDKQNLPLFGAKYHFQLEGVVNCPEFLVYFPLLEKLAEKYNMKLVYRLPFADFFKKHIETSDGRSLLGKMQALEPYPADADGELMSKEDASYAYIKEYIDNQQLIGGDNRRPLKVGTLSLPEWEATTIYLAFAFQRLGEPKLTGDGTGEPSRKRRHDDVTLEPPVNH